VLGLEDDTDAFRHEVLLQPPGHLARQPFLHLQATGEELDDPGQLGEPEDPPGGDVPDVGRAVEGAGAPVAETLFRSGLLTGLELPQATARLDPGPGRCCVRISK